MKLTALEVGWPGRLRETAVLLDGAGFTGYWMTEHYGSGRSASPAVLAGICGASTPSAQLRVGSAAILLGHHRPFEVACEFAALESQFPGRVDLGIASGAVPGGRLDREDACGGGSFEERARELVRLLRHDGESIGPPMAKPPALWVCGTGARSAALAAEIGAGFAVFDDPGERARGVALAECYRSCFRASGHAGDGDGPVLCVAMHGLCTLRAEDAGAVWAHVGTSPGFLGGPRDCREQIADVGAAYGTDSVAVACITPSYVQQCRSYELLAEAIV